MTHVTVDWPVNQDNLRTMTLARLIPLSMHAALEMLLGMVAMAAPFALALGPGATILGVVLGALLVGMALTLVVDEGSLPISAHYAFDYGLVLGLLGAAVVIGLAGDRAGTAFLAAIGITQLALNVTTRYSAGR
jgi:hypothetical protein